MELRRYLFEENMTITEFAKIVECHRNYISQIALGNLAPSKRLAKDIERATEGKVTAEELLNPKPKKKK